MQRDVPADAWFFASTAKRTPYNFNINTNQQVGVTNVWVNVLVTETLRPSPAQATRFAPVNFADVRCSV